MVLSRVLDPHPKSKNIMLKGSAGPGLGWVIREGGSPDPGPAGPKATCIVLRGAKIHIKFMSDT